MFVCALENQMENDEQKPSGIKQLKHVLCHLICMHVLNENVWFVLSI